MECAYKYVYYVELKPQYVKDTTLNFEEKLRLILTQYFCRFDPWFT